MEGPYDTGRFADIGDFDLSAVTSSFDVAEVIRLMLNDLVGHPAKWENATLERFLEALAASWEALPAAYAHHGQQFPQVPTWKIVAEALVMASGYE